MTIGHILQLKQKLNEFYGHFGPLRGQNPFNKDTVSYSLMISLSRQSLEGLFLI